MDERRDPDAARPARGAYRDIGAPLLSYLRELTAEPDTVVNVVMPEVVVRGWARRPPQPAGAVHQAPASVRAARDPLERAVPALPLNELPSRRAEPGARLRRGARRRRRGRGLVRATRRSWAVRGAPRRGKNTDSGIHARWFEFTGGDPRLDVRPAGTDAQQAVLDEIARLRGDADDVVVTVVIPSSSGRGRCSPLRSVRSFA